MSIRELPDFLKTGDPAPLSPRRRGWPHGKQPSPNHPRGRAVVPAPPTGAELARDWLRHVAAGRIGPRGSP